MNTREKKAAHARRLLGDELVIAFLRRCRDEPEPRACRYVNDDLDRGSDLNAIFYDGNLFGYELAAKATGPNRYRISFGYGAGPEEGDGGVWILAVAPDGRIESLELTEVWTA